VSNVGEAIYYLNMLFANCPITKNPKDSMMVCIACPYSKWCECQEIKEGILQKSDVSEEDIINRFSEVNV